MKTILVTMDVLSRVAEGHPNTATTLDGEEFRVYCPYRVEDEGILKGLPNVPMAFDQLRRVAMGGSAIAYLEFSGSDDYLTQVEVRLPTLPEFRQMKDRAKAWFEDNDLYYPEQPSEESQLWLITPLPASF